MTHKNEQSRMAGNTSCLRTRKHPLGTLRLIPKPPTAPPKSAAGRTELPQMKRPDFPATPVRPRCRFSKRRDPFLMSFSKPSPLRSEVFQNLSPLWDEVFQ